MPVMTRPRSVTTDARSRLAEAHANLAIARDAVTEAEAALDEAQTAYWRAKDVVGEIEARMAHIAGQWNTLHPQAREGLQEKYDDCRPALKEAKQPLMQLSMAVEAAEAQAAKARQHASFAQARLHDAATSAVQAEVPAVAQPMVEQIEAAFATILANGPNLFCLINNRLLPADALDPNITRLLNIATTEWPEFGRRFQTSPWRNAAAALEQDANALLPIGPVG